VTEHISRVSSIEKIMYCLHKLNKSQGDFKQFRCKTKGLSASKVKGDNKKRKLLYHMLKPRSKYQPIGVLCTPLSDL
jgi:hypothetical protein